ncbi:serine hydrolase [Nakamurella alba]|nr:serine hydrolase [Nakamurella alba]
MAIPRRTALTAALTGLVGVPLAACTSTDSGGARSTAAPVAETTAMSSDSPPTSSTAAGSATATSSTEAPVATGNAPVGETAPAAYSTAEITKDKIDAAVAALDDMVADAMERTGVPGIAVAVVHEGEVLYQKGFGVREVGKDAAVDPETVFQLASVSKSIAGTCVAKAVTDKTVTWADKVTDHLPDFELSDPAVTSMVQISDCFAHRTGLPGTAGDELEGFGYDRDYVLSRLRLFPLDPFRITYHYTNFGLTLGGEAVAAADGRSWEDLCQADVYRPIGMTSTSSKYADYLARDNKAIIHFRVAEKDFQPLYKRDADPQSPAGGVSSNVLDMAKWMTVVLDGGKLDGEDFIDDAALLEMHGPHIVNNAPTADVDRAGFYGYGVNVGTTSTGHITWGHAGAFFVGTGTSYTMLPAGKIGIVALSNGSPIGAVEAITTSFTDLVRTGEVERDWVEFFGAIYGNFYINRSSVAEPPPASPKAARALTDYAGDYANDYLGQITVAVQGDALEITGVGPNKLAAPLVHYDGDVFSWKAPGGNGDDDTAVTFAGGGTGAATEVTLEAVMIGTLKRV